LYSANRLPEIADDIVNIDNAMKWGFAWSKGPFEMWDDLGILTTIERMRLDGRKIPEWVNKMTDSGFIKFYKFIDGKECYYDPQSNSYQLVDKSEKEFSFNSLKQNNKLIKHDWSASLVDLGNGVAGLEFHSVLKADLNPIDGSIMQSIQNAVNWVKDNGYSGLVISGDSTNFSAGANLNIILNAAQRKDWSGIELVSKSMQDILQMVRFSSFPVVAAPFGLVLGGGFEVIGACDKIIAAAESYIGLVEVGVGLIPGAGGNLRMLRNISEKIKTPMPGAFPVVQKVFEVVGFAKVATSAKKAQAYGYLRKSDEIVINRGHLLHRAKQVVLEMAPSYQTPAMETFKLPGTSGRLVLYGSIKGFLKSKKISEHDALIAKKLGYVLTGGDKGGPFSPVDEQYLLDIEREAFVSLCGEPKSIKRIEYMLTNGKPLRN
jgi:3-hydroxyacyl-CoA dehydrogenase